MNILVSQEMLWIFLVFLYKYWEAIERLLRGYWGAIEGLLRGYWGAIEGFNRILKEFLYLYKNKNKGGKMEEWVYLSILRSTIIVGFILFIRYDDSPKYIFPIMINIIVGFISLIYFLYFYSNDKNITYIL